MIGEQSRDGRPDVPDPGVTTGRETPEGRQIVDAIQGRCPACGDVILDPSEALLESPDHVAGRHRLSFDCPRCSRPFRTTVDDTVARALRRAGVATRGGPGHPEDPPAGPVLDHDDLLDLHLLLDSDRWFEDLLALVGDRAGH
jgi:hypothetical protein